MKKWFKPRGKPMVLVDEKEIDKIIIKNINASKKVVKKKNEKVK